MNSKNKNNKIKYLAVGGGGIFGFKYLGILSKYDLSYVKSYCGCSIGGFLCYFLSIGYECEEFFKKVIDMDPMDYTNISLSNVFNMNNGYGLDTGDKLFDLFYELSKNKLKIFYNNIENKNNIKNKMKNITFEELFLKTKKKLTLTGSCINNGKIKYFNYKNTPNMKVFDAIRITISFPFIFTPVYYKNKMYVDGAFYCPNPKIFFRNKKDENVICILPDYLTKKINEKTEINDVQTYFFYFMDGMKKQYFKNSIKTMINIIFVKEEQMDEPLLLGMNLSLSKKNKIKLYIEGQNISN